MGYRRQWTRMGDRVCICGLSVHVSWWSRHGDAGCDARVGLSKDNQFNASRIILGDYIKATGSDSRKELEGHLLANFPPGVSWEATPYRVEGVVDGYIKFWHLEG